MNCRQLVDLVTHYLDRALSEEDRAQVEAHLAECEGCRNYVEQIRVTIQLMNQLYTPAPPAALRDELLSAFQKWSSETPQDGEPLG